MRVRHDISSRLIEKNPQDKDLFSLLENELGQDLHSADMEIDATASIEEIGRRLKVQARSSILGIERLTSGSEDRPLVLVYIHYCADSFKFKLNILHR